MAPLRPGRLPAVGGFIYYCPACSKRLEAKGAPCPFCSRPPTTAVVYNGHAWQPYQDPEWGAVERCIRCNATRGGTRPTRDRPRCDQHCIVPIAPAASMPVTWAGVFTLPDPITMQTDERLVVHLTVPLDHPDYDAQGRQHCTVRGWEIVRDDHDA